MAFAKPSGRSFIILLVVIIRKKGHEHYCSCPLIRSYTTFLMNKQQCSCPNIGYMTIYNTTWTQALSLPADKDQSV